MQFYIWMKLYSFFSIFLLTYLIQLVLAETLAFMHCSDGAVSVMYRPSVLVVGASDAFLPHVAHHVILFSNHRSMLLHAGLTK